MITWMNELIKGARRWFGRAVFAIMLSLPLGACAEKEMNLDVVVFNYWPRAIADVSVNGQYAGGSFGGFGPGGTGGKTVTGVPIKLGRQQVSWVLDGGEGAPRLGEAISASAELKKVPRDAKYLAIYIYPNETVEVATSHFYPDDSKKGEALKHGRL
jgi:hypothetical protein